MVEEPTRQPQKFNMAIATLIRLDGILKACAITAQTGNLIGWHDSLLTLRRNIFSFVSKTNREKINEMITSLNSKQWVARTKGKLHIIPTEISRVWTILDELEIYMQTAMDDAGLLMPKSDDPRFALEG